MQCGAWKCRAAAVRWIKSELRPRVARLRALKKELNSTYAVSHLEGADYINLLSKGRGKAVVPAFRAPRCTTATLAGLVGWLRKKVLMPWLYQPRR